MPRTLTAEAKADREEFEVRYGSGNCACHLYAPCGSCLHPGNPANQDDDNECWTDDTEETVNGKHELKREHGGQGNTSWIRPTCSCGWIGISQFAYNDDQYTEVQRQENQHIRGTKGKQ